MSTMLIAQNETRQSGSFCGDQLCSLKTAYCFVENQPDVDRVIMSVSPGNEMGFLWDKFIGDPRGDGSVPPVTLVHDDWDPGDWLARHAAWDGWRRDRRIALDDGTVEEFQHYRELYLRVHGAQRQQVICGSERGLGRRNIYEYWLAGQENRPDHFVGTDWFDDTLIHHPPHTRDRDVYISPQAKTQGNLTFTFDWWADVVHRLVRNGVSVTVGYEGWFCEDLAGHPYYRKHWGDHRQWMEEVCRHKLVACGNTGTGWLAAACGVPMVTVEPHHSVMADHRYRACGLRNMAELIGPEKLDELDNNMSRVAEYAAQRVTDEIRRCVVMTTGCYDVIHAGHVRHLERARALGTRLIVALNSDESVHSLKGPGRPINSAQRRRTVLEALRCVDEVRVFDGPDARPLLRELRPDVLAVGFGYKLDDIVGRDIVEGYGGRAVVTCDGDAADEPSTTKIVRAVRAARAADAWEAVRAAAPYSVNPPEKLRLMADQLVSVAEVPGDVVDLGAYRGACAYVMDRLAPPDRRLHVIDTWRGNPHDDPMCHHKAGEWRASLAECRALVGSSSRVHYWQGVFPADHAHIPALSDAKFSFVYVDVDTYAATRDAIAFFWLRMSPGGKIVIDDYGWEPCAGVRVAVDEAFPLELCNAAPAASGGIGRSVVQSLYTVILERAHG